MKPLIRRPEFPETAGTVFLEMKTGNQDRINQFMNGEKLDRQLLLDILGVIISMAGMIKECMSS